MQSCTADGVGNSMFCICAFDASKEQNSYDCKQEVSKAKLTPTLNLQHLAQCQSSLQTRARSKRMHLTISCDRPANRLHLFQIGDNDHQILRLLAAPGVSLPADEPPLKALL